MSDTTFKTEAPTLIFDAATAQEQQLPVTTESREMTEEIKLTPEEQAQVDEFAKQIDITNSNAILNYGAGTQKKLSDFSEKSESFF